MSEARVRNRARVLGAAIVLFGVLVGAAMLTYHGGSHFDQLATRYAPTGNFLSDLGMTTTFAGRANAVPRGLFAAASLLIGGALAWSAPAWRAWDRAGRATGAADVAVYAAVLAGMGFAAVGAVPQDRFLGPHMAVVDTAFLLLLLFVATLAVVQRRNGAPRAVWITNAVTAVLLAGYTGLVLRTDLADPTSLRVAIVAQKLAIAVVLGDVAFQVRGLAISVRHRDPDGPGGLGVSRVGAA